MNKERVFADWGYNPQTGVIYGYAANPQEFKENGEANASYTFVALVHGTKFHEGVWGAWWGNKPIVVTGNSAISTLADHGLQEVKLGAQSKPFKHGTK